MIRLRRFSLIALAAFAAACSDPHRPGSDAGTPTDGGVDGGGIESDAGTESDAGDAPDAGTPDAGPIDAGPPRFPACDPQATTQTISFVHVNDLHANYQLDANGVSPYSLIRGAYVQAKAANPFTLFTSGGDEYEKGAVAEQLSAGRATHDILFGMKFDARVIGNHDYGWSEASVLEDSLDPYSIVLSTNVTYRGTSAFGAKRYAEMQVGCVKIGLMGLTSGPWNELDQYSEANFYPSFPTDLDYTGQTQRIVDAHRADVDLLIAITHIGEGRDEGLAAAVDGLDIILGGHSHTTLNEAVLINGTIITQAGWKAAAVSQLDVTVDLSTRHIAQHQYVLSPVDTLQTPDPATQTLIETTLQTYAPEASAPRGTLESSLTIEQVGLLAAKAAVSELHANAAVLDLATVWKRLFSGAVTQQDFLSSFQVERQPPGTPGFSSFYSMSIEGASLQRLKDELGSESWAGVYPASINPTATYRIILQKRTAMHPDLFLPTGIAVSGTPAFESEVWETLDKYAVARTAACSYLATDASLPTCPN